MTSWIDFVLDVAPIKAIFGSELPTLERVDLHEITLHRDGPRVLLRFDLKNFPSHPPKKWSSEGFNRVQIRLVALGIKTLQIDGWQSNITVDLSIIRDDLLVHISADNGAVRFQLGAESIIVEGISAYRDGASN